MKKNPRKSSNFPRFLVAFILAFFTVSAELCAQPRFLESGYALMRGDDVGIYRDVPTRRKIDLSGAWEFSQNGEAWSRVNVPSSMDVQGKIQFRRKFTVSRDDLSTSAFKFVSYGINHECEIYVNGNFVGKHIGGYTAFEYAIPLDALELGSENVIQINVVNELNSRSTIPLRKHVWAWRNYGGLVRDLFFLITPRVWIDDVDLKPSIADGAVGGMLSVKATVSNISLSDLRFDTVVVKGKPLPQPLRVLTAEVIDAASGTVVGQNQTPSMTFELNKDAEAELSVNVPAPKRWSAESPNLYTVLVSLVLVDGKSRTTIDGFKQRVGFVSRQLDGQSIRINGQEAVLKGVVWHEEAPDVGMSLSYDRMEKDIATIKSLGANAVRFAFHPPHPYVVELCARYGLYALEELPLHNLPAKILSEESFTTTADAALREMIVRDRSNPAVLAWGLGSQFDGTKFATVEFARALKRVAASLDERPVYFGSRMPTGDLASAEVPLAALVMPPTDLRSFKKIVGDWKRSHTAQPVLITGYGKEVDHGNRNGWSDPMSQEAQARFFLQYYAAIKESGVAGSFVDAYADWRGDRPVMTVNQPDNFLHPLGLVSEHRERRLSFDMVRTLFNGEKTSAILVGSYRSSFPLAHVLSGLAVIILLAYQYTYNRRFGEAVRRSLTRSYNFYADLRDSRAVSIVHTFILAFCVSVTLAVILSSVLYYYRTDKLADYLLSYILTWDALKVRFIYATWHPVAGIVEFSAFFFLLFMVFAVVIKFCSYFVRARVTWFHAYSVAAWGAIPIVFLSPVAMSLFKVMENPLYIIPSAVLVAGFLIWTWMRLVSGVSVVYDVSPLRAYIGAVFVCLAFTGVLVFYYESTYAILSYASLAVHVIRHALL